jgi:hypothetical protein
LRFDVRVELPFPVKISFGFVERTISNSVRKLFMARLRRRLCATNAVKRATAGRFALAILPIIADIRATGITSLNGIARELRRRDVVRPRVGRWSASTVRAVLFRTIAPEIRAEACRGATGVVRMIREEESPRPLLQPEHDQLGSSGSAD